MNTDKTSKELKGNSTNLLLLAVRFITEILDRRRVRGMLAKLHSLPKEEWIRIGHQFNSWTFPMEFYEFMPNWWVKKGKWNGDRAYRIVHPICETVRNEVGEKEGLRYHNVYKGKMTNEEFEYWFANIRMQSKNINEDLTRKYYDRRVKMDTVRWWEDEVFEKLSTVADFKHCQ
jgi:polyhydroxyalkanoate synthesis regulator phasin